MHARINPLHSALDDGDGVSSSLKLLSLPLLCHGRLQSGTVGPYTPTIVHLMLRARVCLLRLSCAGDMPPNRKPSQVYDFKKKS